jgi:hypothetical protein
MTEPVKPGREAAVMSELGNCDGHFDLLGSRLIFGRPHAQNAHCTNWKPVEPVSGVEETPTEEK